MGTDAQSGSRTDVCGEGGGTTLMISNLPEDVTERELLMLFNREAEYADAAAVAVESKLARDPHEPEKCVGYGFVEFCSHEEAVKALTAAKDGLRLMGRPRFASVQWAKGRQGTPIDSYDIYVGSLPTNVTDGQLFNFFQRTCENSIKRAKIIRDKITGASMGYAFVLLTSSALTAKCLKILQGVARDGIAELNIGPRVLVVREVYRVPESDTAAVSRPSGRGGGGLGRTPAVAGGRNSRPVSAGGQVSALAAANTTVFVANIAPGVTENQLTEVFGKFGSVLSIRQAFLKHLAFITFMEHVPALAAICHLSGSLLNQQKISLAWGRSRHSAPPAERIQSIVDREHLDAERNYSLEWHQAMAPSTARDAEGDGPSRKRDRSVAVTGEMEVAASESYNCDSGTHAMSGKNDMSYWLAQLAGGVGLNGSTGHQPLAAVFTAAVPPPMAPPPVSVDSPNSIGDASRGEVLEGSDSAEVKLVAENCGSVPKSDAGRNGNDGERESGDKGDGKEEAKCRVATVRKSRRIAANVESAQERGR